MALQTVTSCVMKIWECVDLSYLYWLLWIFYPIIITFLLPFILVILLYATALFIHIYPYWQMLRAAWEADVWDGMRKTVAAIWACHGQIYHGYQIEGLDNIPDQGAALIVYYHGVVPVDMYYVMANCLLKKGRLVHNVGDKFLFKIPGWRRMLRVFNVTEGTRSMCLDVLSSGNLLAIAPGGVREALFGDENYGIMWSKRHGFAEIALETSVPVIPMFTENCREVFRTPLFARKLLRRVYEWLRLPIVPIYGNIPVKSKLEELIMKHQRLPGNIPRALFQRFRYHKKEN
ncbi:hypothetical protein ACOMHN_061402 [Nucella lapillus]